MIRDLDGGAKIGVVAHGLVAVLALWCFQRADAGETVLAPARTDDLPYGDLITLNRSGALVWLAVAAVGLVCLLRRYRAMLLVVAGFWLALASVGSAVAAGWGSLFGMTRAGDVAVTLGLACTTLICGLPPRRPASSAPAAASDAGCREPAQ